MGNTKKNEVLTVDELEKQGFKFYKSALVRGYISRKLKDGIIYPYNGRYGTGYIHRQPNWRSTRYYPISYYIKPSKTTQEMKETTMKKEKYIIAATKDREHFIHFAILAECHCQHIWKETELQGVSKAGGRKLDQLVSEGYVFYAHTIPNQPRIISW